MPASATAYVECFGGSLAMALSRPSLPVEVLNDFDAGMANVYRVLQSDRLDELQRRLRWTLHSRREHATCSEAEALRVSGELTDEDPVEWARRHLVLIRQSFSAEFDASWGYCREQGRNPFPDIVKRVPPVAERIKHATIENLHFRDLIVKYAGLGANSLWYFDPPYVPETRVCKSAYRCEMTVSEHTELLSMINEIDGMVLLSGYRCDLYDEHLGDWMRVERRVWIPSANSSQRSRTDASRPRRTECLWLNQAVQDRLRSEGRL